MSCIEIKCIKHDDEREKDYKAKERNVQKGTELILKSSQWFMNTEKFFNSVKPTLEKYFDKIEKK